MMIWGFWGIWGEPKKCSDLMSYVNHSLVSYVSCKNTKILFVM